MHGSISPKRQILLEEKLPCFGTDVDKLTGTELLKRFSGFADFQKVATDDAGIDLAHGGLDRTVPVILDFGLVQAVVFFA